MHWILGLFVSLFVGGVVTALSLVHLRKYLEKREDEFKEFSRGQKFDFYFGIDFYPPLPESVERQVPLWITGTTERLFFTFVVAFDLGGAAVAMIGWITLKMLASRKYREQSAKEEGATTPLAFEFAGLLGNLSSMFFALVGGLICRAAL
jgi:uncharacterized membrane protein